jgi:hypothetical protein
MNKHFCWLAPLAMATFSSACLAQTASRTNYCSLLSAQEAAAVVGAPVVVAGDPALKPLAQTQLLTQECRYETKEKEDFRRKFVKIIFTEAPSADIAAKLFDAENKIFVQGLSLAADKPVAALGDQTVALKSGGLYLRQGNVCAHMQFDSHLVLSADDEKLGALMQGVATKIVARLSRR